MVSSNLLKLSKKLFDSQSDQEAFVACFENPVPKERSFIWLKNENLQHTLPPYDFQPEWAGRFLPTEDIQADHEKGLLYILDSSSVFAAAPLLQLKNCDLIFDACAAPGGKSVFAWRALRPRLIIANEFVEKRLKPLISNFQRCAIAPSEVFHLSTKRIGQMFEKAFPLLLVDAPCSGQSLLLKGEKVDGAFHPQTVNGNAMRQRRILAEIAPSVSPGGHMLYMTCTFSPEENEEIVKWFLKKFPNFVPVEVDLLSKYRSHLADFACYRLWPQSGKGAGSFTALLRNTEQGERLDLPVDYKPVWKNDQPLA